MQIDGQPGERAESLRQSARRDGWYVGTHNAALCPNDAVQHGVGPKAARPAASPHSERDTMTAEKIAAARAEMMRRGYRPVYGEPVILELSYPGYLPDCDFCMRIGEVTYLHPATYSVSACQDHTHEAIAEIKERTAEEPAGDLQTVVTRSERQ